MNINLNCVDAFKQGHIRRQNYPLYKGSYKLEEAKFDLNRYKSGVEDIRKNNSRKFGDSLLLQCTEEDQHIWLCNLPAIVADTMSFKVLPGLLALTNEGVDESIVQNMHQQLNKDSISLVHKLELARQQMLKEISYEYALMKSGRSVIEPFIDEGISITKRALAIFQPKYSIAA
jgi:hypothetical protein